MLKDLYHNALNDSYGHERSDSDPNEDLIHLLRKESSKLANLKTILDQIGHSQSSNSAVDPSLMKSFFDQLG
jgi:hypothetical protein